MKTITRKEYQEYLKEQRQGTTSTLISNEMREFIKANESDILRAFIGTNISVISFYHLLNQGTKQEEQFISTTKSQPLKEPKEFAKELVDMYHKKYGYPSGLSKDSIPIDIKGITALIEQARTYYTKQTE